MRLSFSCDKNIVTVDITKNSAIIANFAKKLH